jgi:hydroxylamine dehydrogenase
MKRVPVGTAAGCRNRGADQPLSPMELIDGQKGCGGCHKVGLKSEAEITQMKANGSTFGHAACDSCHTRHTFSVAEAREPEACATCHMGFDHPQWEMYSTSKHGIRHSLKRDGILPATASAPTCQDCHMADGDHEVRTAWGFLAVRTNGLERYPGESDQWWADRVTILMALGVLDPEGNPTARLDLVAGAQVARLSAEEFDKERAKMVVAAYAYPDLLTFHDSPAVIENRLFTMHLKHRMRAFQGAFHMNPDYTLWYGWNEMVQDLNEIRIIAKEMREKQKPE